MHYLTNLQEAIALLKTTDKPAAENCQVLSSTHGFDQVEFAIQPDVSGHCHVHYRVRGSIFIYAAVALIWKKFNLAPMTQLSAIDKQALIKELGLPEQLSHKVDTAVNCWNLSIKNQKNSWR